MEMLCEYGCGQEAKYQFKNGKWCCSDKFQKCPGHINNKRKKIKESTIEYYKNETKNQKLKRIKSHKKFWTEENRKDWSKKAMVYNQKNKRTISKIKKKYPTFYNVEEMRYNPDKPGEKEIQVHCKNHNCPNSKEQGGWFTPTSRQLEWRIMALEHYGCGGRNFYCCDECKQECPLYGFNPNYDFVKNDNKDTVYSQTEYHIFRNEVLKRQKEIYGYNFCELCYSTKKLHVHHEKPQKIYPILALDPDNGIILCMDCHLKKIHTNECSATYLNKKCKGVK